MKQISISVPETAHWHALIGKAEHIARHMLPQGIENYLIRLFMRIEQEDKAVFFETKQQKFVDSTEYKLQRLGDQCLMLCGFYPEASEEYGVAIEEFVSMGVESYKKLASLEYGENEIIFEYLTENFIQVSELLNFINQFSDKSVTKQHYQLPNEDDDFSLIFNTGSISFSSPISHRVLN
ncbi:MAG: hypothetical protein HND53_10835 [Proteobacteria bacterium]|nr:hypothetical protein [Pseudomonadota bacterium]NOG60987.1 hypothetical protein [Pseudomonadota bacterium]